MGKSLSVALLETLLCFSVSSVRTLLCHPVEFCCGIGVPIFSLAAFLSEWAWPHSRSLAYFPHVLLSHRTQPCSILARLTYGVWSLNESLSPWHPCHGSAVAQSSVGRWAKTCLMVTDLACICGHHYKTWGFFPTQVAEPTLSVTLWCLLVGLQNFTIIGLGLLKPSLCKTFTKLRWKNAQPF